MTKSSAEEVEPGFRQTSVAAIPIDILGRALFDVKHRSTPTWKLFDIMEECRTPAGRLMGLRVQAGAATPNFTVGEEALIWYLENVEDGVFVPYILLPRGTEFLERSGLIKTGYRDTQEEHGNYLTGCACWLGEEAKAILVESELQEQGE